MTSKEIAEKLEERGLDLTTVARRAGIPIGAAVQILTGKREPTDDEGDALAAAIEGGGR